MADNGFEEYIRGKLRTFEKGIRHKLIATRDIRKLKQRSFQVTFPDEGGVVINLPNLTHGDAMNTGGAATASKSLAFSNRPHHEVLLRKVIFQMFEDKIIEKTKSIIDIGAWIGDNSLVWAKLIDAEKANVFSIDPSAENINFGKNVAALNDVKNISWHQNVCSDTAGQHLGYDGGISHASFSQAKENEKNIVVSSTVDIVIGEDNHDKIGLFHIDVEGFEESVLLGSKSLIEKSKPIILFEQHISTENMSGIFKFLNERDYKIYMINEVLPGCALDCRNFLAAPASVDLDTFITKNLTNNAVHKIYEAIPGPSLVIAQD